MSVLYSLMPAQDARAQDASIKYKYNAVSIMLMLTAVYWWCTGMKNTCLASPFFFPLMPTYPLDEKISAQQ